MLKSVQKKSVSDDRPPSQSMSNFIIIFHITGSVLQNALGEWGLKSGLEGAPALESCQRTIYYFFIYLFSVQNNLLEIESTTPHQWLQLHPT